MKRKSLEQCKREGTLTGSSTLEAKNNARELIALTELRQRFWKETKQKAKKYPSLFIEGHYEIIKELATPIIMLDGWRPLDHECLFSYLKYKRQELEIDFDYLFDLKDTRNEIDYRGLMVIPQTWKNNELKIQLTISAMREHLTKRLQ